MTKAELTEYLEELEGAIDSAVEALEADDPDKAMKILSEYTGEEPEEE